ncbi:MAG: hypothetical protein HC787_01530 [Nostocaceae cyanobacterium CSU_2_110]|nr:hypothetical protein [Nostocaceae cyanobacterium CSU_2_110]
MRLSPFLVTVIALTTPLGVSISANAQNVKSSEKSQDIFPTAGTNQVDTSVVKVANKLQVVIPTSNSTTAQNTPQIPPPDNLPSGNQEPVPSPAPEILPH